MLATLTGPFARARFANEPDLKRAPKGEPGVVTHRASAGRLPRPRSACLGPLRRRRQSGTRVTCRNWQAGARSCRGSLAVVAWQAHSDKLRRDESRRYAPSRAKTHRRGQRRRRPRVSHQSAVSNALRSRDSCAGRSSSGGGGAQYLGQPAPRAASLAHSQPGARWPRHRALRARSSPAARRAQHSDCAAI